MDGAFARFTRQHQFGSLDGLRAIAILAVVCFHSARKQVALFDVGHEGVTLFFAISGFLITTLLLRERSRAGDINLKNFYARRTLRIFPLYYAVLLLYVVLVAVVEPRSDEGRAFFANLPYFATYTANWFVPLHGRVIFYFAWSLATEEQFYLLWPSMERWLPEWASAALAVGLVAVQAWAASGSDVDVSLVRVVLRSIAPAICFGVVLAHLLHRRRTFDVVAAVLARRWASPVLALLLVACIALGSPSFPKHLSMTLLVGACVVREDHALARVLQSRPLVSIGRVSYGMYLLHMLITQVVEKVLTRLGANHPYLRVACVVGGAWGLALLSFRYFEGPLLRLKTRFARPA